MIITFAALHPNVSVSDFRFQGTENQGFNGIEADLNNGAGTIKVRGTITSAHPWRVRLIDGDFNQVANQTGSGTQIAYPERHVHERSASDRRGDGAADRGRGLSRRDHPLAVGAGVGPLNPPGSTPRRAR